MVRSESFPAIDCPQGFDLSAYWQQIQARFKNPNIQHQLEQISHDGSQKIPVRLFPLILGQLRQKQVAQYACFVIAAWLVFNHQRRAAQNPPTDGYLEQLRDSLPSAGHCIQEYIAQFLANRQLFPDDIIQSPQICEAITDSGVAIAQYGLLTAISLCVGDTTTANIKVSL